MDPFMEYPPRGSGDGSGSSNQTGRRSRGSGMAPPGSCAASSAFGTVPMARRLTR